METIKIVSIDPGNNLGIAVFELTVPEFKILSITTDVIVLDNLVSSLYGDRMLNKLCALQKITSAIYTQYNPVAVGIEAAFLNTRFPKAVMQLSQYVSTVELTIKNNNPYIKIFKYAPKYIKSYSIKNGNADKNDMANGISKINELTKHVTISNITEHEVDAIAIGYVLLNEIRETPFILYTL